MKQFFILLSFFVFLPGLFSQAWTKPKGNGFYKLDFTTITGNKVFDDKSEIKDVATYSFNTISLYGEYGISDKLTVVGYVPFQSNSTETQNKVDNLKNSGLSDIDVALRYALSTEKFPLTVTVQLGIPSGSRDDKNQLYTGDGEFNQFVKLASGLGKDNWWIQGGVGFNNRSKDFSDELRFDVELGYKFLNKKLLTILKFGGISPMDNGSASLSTTGLYSNNVAYFAPALEVLYYIKPEFGVSFRGAGASPSSRNVQATPSISFAFFADLK